MAMGNRHVSWSRKLGGCISNCKHKAATVTWKEDDSVIALNPTPQ